MSFQSTPREWPVPSAFIAASLAAKRPARCGTGFRRCGTIGNLAVGEHAAQEAVAVSLEARPRTRGMSVASNPRPRIFMSEPQPTGAFEWTQAPWGAVLRCVPLSAAAAHFFTGEQPDAARRSGRVGGRRRARLASRSRTCCSSARCTRRPWPSRQPTGPVPGRGRRPTRSSATIRRAAIAVRVADCVPVLLAEETGPGRRGHPCRMARHRQPGDHRRRERAADHVRRPPRAHHRGRRPVHRPVLLRSVGEHLPDVPPGRAPRSVLERWFEPRPSRRESSTSTCGARRAINSRGRA